MPMNHSQSVAAQVPSIHVNPQSNCRQAVLPCPYQIYLPRQRGRRWLTRRTDRQRVKSPNHTMANIAHNNKREMNFEELDVSGDWVSEVGHITQMFPFQLTQTEENLSLIPSGKQKKYTRGDKWKRSCRLSMCPSFDPQWLLEHHKQTDCHVPNVPSSFIKEHRIFRPLGNAFQSLLG